MTMTNKCDCLNDCGDDPDILKTAVQPCETQLSSSDRVAVDHLAGAMKRKLTAARAKGRSGWDSPECTQQHLSNLLREHVDKGDPVDVANFCAFLSARGEMIAQAVPAVVPGAAIRRIERTNFPNSPAQAALSAFLSAMFDQGLNGADMRAAMLWFLGFEECEEPSASTQAAPVNESRVALRRDYLNTAREVAVRTPTEANVALPIALTQELLRDVIGEPAIEIRISGPDSAMLSEGA